MPTSQEERNHQIVQERATGCSLTAIAARHGITQQHARTITREHIDDLELRLLRNRQTDEVELFLVPFQRQDLWQTALSYFDWCVRELRKRDIEVKIHKRDTPEGTVFAIEDVTDYSRSNG